MKIQSISPPWLSLLLLLLYQASNLGHNIHITLW